MALSEESIEVTRLLKEVIVFFKHKMNKAFEKSGLTVPQGMLLAVLGKEGKLNIHELGDRLFMTNSTVSGVVDRLEKLGIVERARCS
ncbi:MAG: MarR family transcriptional regulator [Brevinematales bacterium]